AEETKITQSLIGRSALNLFTKPERNSHKVRRILLLHVGKRSEDGAVCFAFVDRSAEGGCQLFYTVCRSGLVVCEVAIGLEVEGIFVDVATKEKRVTITQSMTNTEFVENICVVDREISDDEISG